MTALAERLSVWGFEDNFTVFDDGSLGFGLRLTPVDISSWDDDRVNAFATSVRQFLNGLPYGVDLQFMQKISGNNEETIERHLNLKAGMENPLLFELTQETRRLFEGLNSAGLIPKQNLILFVRRKFRSELFKKQKIWQSTNKFVSISEESFASELEAIKRLEDDIVSSLRSLDIKVHRLDPEVTLEEMYDLWNPERPLEHHWHKQDDVRDSLLFTDVVISDKGFSLGGMHHRVLSLKSLPDQTFSGMAQGLSQLPFASKLFVTIHVPEQQREIESLQMQRRLAFSMVQGKAHGIRDIDSESKLEDLETLLEDMLAQGEKVFQVSVNIVLRSTGEEDLEAQVSEVLMKVRELSGSEAMEESYAAFDIFSELAPPHAREKERKRRLKTSNLADFIPLYGPWGGHDTPRALLRSRSGSLLSFDPFSSDLSNSNQLVSGCSGAGKSFLVNTLLLQMLKENPKIFIVDIGGSYKKMTESLGGQYISLGVGNAFSLNPFDLREGEIRPDDHKMKFLVSLIEIMAKEDDTSRLPRLERAELEASIKELYDKSIRPSLTSLKTSLRHTVMRKLEVLVVYCRLGAAIRRTEDL